MAAALVAQQAQESDTVFRADTRIVVCHTTVIDKTGHLVTTLPQSAFTVYENKIKQDIRRFKREDVPVALGLVIDNSGSMRNKPEKVKAAAMRC
jgi:VWFA-related protein